MFSFIFSFIKFIGYSLLGMFYTLLYLINKDFRKVKLNVMVAASWFVFCGCIYIPLNVHYLIQLGHLIFVLAYFNREGKYFSLEKSNIINIQPNLEKPTTINIQQPEKRKD